MFTAPSLLLKDISIPDLLQKRLKSSGAELYRPLIVLSAKRKEVTPGIKPASKLTAGKIALFYHTLHEMSELINAPDFNITEGAVRYTLTGIKPLELNVNNLNVHILLNQFFVSDSLVDIKHAIPDLRIGELSLASKGLQIKVKNYRLDGVRRYNWGEQLQVSTADGTELNGAGIYWKIFDWDIYQMTRGIQIDSLHVDELSVHSVRATHSAVENSGRQTDSSKNFPEIRIGKLNINKILFDKKSENSSLHVGARNLNADAIQSTKNSFTWGNVKMNVAPIDLDEKNRKAHIGAVSFDNSKETILNDLKFESEGRQGRINLSVPLIRMKVYLHSSDFSQLSIPSFLADNATLSYTKSSGKDTLAVNANIKIQARNIITFKDAEKFIQVGEVKAEWKDARLLYKNDSTELSVNRLSGSFNDNMFTLIPPVKVSWQQLAAKTTVSDGDLHYKGKKITADVAGYSWSPSGNILHLNHFSIIPNESREATFNKAPWQNDYITIKGESLVLSGIRIDHSAGDSSIRIRDSSIRINKLILDGVAINASRDKSMPFRHGIEKPMPTKLINTIPFPLKVDSVLLFHSSVVYNELSIATRKWSQIPFENLTGVILNVSNRGNQQATLRIFATAELFNSRIRHFSYEESYGDPLSAFTVRSRLSPIDLTGFSQVSIPMAAVSVTHGHADTLYSNWEGNKYAATGTMNFYYDHLRIRVLNKEDIQKRSLLPVLKTWAANLILPNSRKRSSAIFVERDQEKFVFNYWVKAMSSGVLTTIGIKRGKAYRKKYLKKYKQYSLPRNPTSS
jgi:hypothetical protein